MTSSSQEALDERELRPAQQPEIKPEGDMEKVAAGEEDLVYSMDVEIMPKFETEDVSKLELERPVAEVSDEQVTEALNRLAENNKKYEDRKANAKAKKGDAVVVDFVGKIDGEAFDGGAAEDQTIVLGDDRFIPGFEDRSVGQSKPLASGLLCGSNLFCAHIVSQFLTRCFRLGIATQSGEIEPFMGHDIVYSDAKSGRINEAHTIEVFSS